MKNNSTQKKSESKVSKKDDSKLYVIAIGASAGGLEALQSFLRHLPALDNVCVIIAQHVSPTHKSMMVPLLSKVTSLEIKEAEEKDILKAGRIFITPPDKQIEIHNKKIKLTKSPVSIAPKPSIDTLFHSLADKYPHNIAVVLSGTGSDAASGVKAIKAGGGFVLVQEPGTAKFDGMPVSAINSGVVDVVLPPEKMGLQIQEYIKNPDKKRVSYFDTMNEDSSLDKILGLLSKKTGTDFSNYKSATISRRLKKRMATLKIENLDEYWSYLEEHPAESDKMFHTILIGVTTFFRDTNAFEVLRKHLEALIKKREPSEPIRIWVPGSSTGEEAYSIAILLHEILQDEISNYRIQIFATDIDENALSIARKGIYSELSLKDMKGELINKYFIKKENEYELIKAVRAMVLFSKHDVTNNPPFLKLDLISCRNLLIYFGNVLQHKVMPIFHYALKNDSYLFLGKSETVGEFTDLFGTLDSRNKLFQRKRGGHLNKYTFSAFKDQSIYTREAKKKIPQGALSISDMVKETLFNSYDHPYVVIDDRYTIREVQGDVRLFMTLSTGGMQADILKMVNSELQLELRSAIAQAMKNKEQVKSQIRKFSLFDHDYYVRITVKPVLFTASSDELYIVIFEKLDIEDYVSRGSEIQNDDGSNIRLQELEHELSVTKEHLQTYIEELETSNEEMQSLNEELQSTNEELQSSNEELETSNEELQSTTEEIQIAYSELESLNNELEEKEKLLLDREFNLEALLTNTLQAFMLIDSSYNIMTYNGKANELSELLRNKPLRIGESIVDFWDKQNLQFLIDQFKQTFKGKTIVGDLQESDSEGNVYWYAYNFTPVLDKDGNPHIISLGFIDITGEKKFNEQLKSTERLLSSIFDSTTNGICITDKDGFFVNVNKEYCRIYGYELDELIGNKFTMVVPPDNQEYLQKLHDDFINGEEELAAEWSVRRKDGSLIDVYASAELLEYDDGSRFKVTAIRDISENKRYKNLLQETQESVGVGGWEFDTINSQLSWSEEVYKIFEVTEGSEISLETMKSNFIEETRVKFDEALQKAITKAIPFDLELKSKIGITDYKWIRISCKPVRVQDRTVKLFGIIQDINHLKISEEIIKAKQKQLSTTFNALPDMVYAMDVEPDSRFVFTTVNEKFLQTIRLAEDEVIGKLLDDVVSKESIEFVKQKYITAAKTGEVQKWEESVTYPNEIKTGIVKITPIMNDEKRCIKIIGSITDITERKNYENTLEELNKKLSNSNKELEEFAFVASHDLQEPLRMITSFLTQLDKKYADQLDDKAKKYIYFATDGAQRMRQIILDLLEYSRVGRTKNELTEVNISDVVENAIALHKQLIDDTNAKINIDDMPIIYAAEGYMKQLFNNLIANALKYQPEGRIPEVDISVKEKPDEWLFSISDNGIGIKEEYQEKIFAIFQRLHTKEEYAGSGMGLTICKKIVENHDGKIWVESIEGKGSTFSFSISKKLNLE